MSDVPATALQDTNRQLAEEVELERERWAAAHAEHAALQEEMQDLKRLTQSLAAGLPPQQAPPAADASTAAGAVTGM